MVEYDKDIRIIKAVGLIIAGLGIVLLMLTLTTVVLGVLNVLPTTAGSYTVNVAAQLILAFIMALTMIGCGTELSRPEPLIASSVESLRLNWVALFGVMFVTWIAGFWLRPELGSLSLIVLVLLLMIRTQIIRIS